MTCTFDVFWREDSTATVLGRIAARGGSGSATGGELLGFLGEGNWLQQADIDSITCQVFDLDAEDPTADLFDDSVTVSSVVLDTPVTTNVIWTVDSIGYNFIHDLPPTSFPDGDHTVRVEYKVTLVDGTVFHGIYQGAVLNVHQS